MFANNIHCYTVYNLKDRKYFTHDYATREEAYDAMIRYMNRHDLTIVNQNECTHCKEYDCTDGYKFYINREY